MRKIDDLVRENESVWFYLNEENKKEFVDEVNHLKLKFSDGSDVTYDNVGDIMAITNHVVAYVSYHVWDMSFYVNNFHKIRVDYERYIQGRHDYLIIKPNIKRII